MDENGSNQINVTASMDRITPRKLIFVDTGKDAEPDSVLSAESRGKNSIF